MNTLSQYLQRTYGEKMYKLSLDGGFTCPNRDGTLGWRGCIFCSAGGSGDFASNRLLSVQKQIEDAKKKTSAKFHGNGYIAYLQAFTSTYASPEYCRHLYREILSAKEVRILSIGTRPDCLPDNILTVLSETNRIKPIWVELGLQTIREDTAGYIRRGYPLAVFEKAVYKLHEIGIPVIVHLILGLPGETKDDWTAAVKYLNQLPIFGVKFQLLHILKGTDLYEDYLADKVPVLTQEEYLDGVYECLEWLRPDIVVHRVTGDGPKSILAAPLWSGDKKRVLNAFNRGLEERNIRQGSRWEKE